MECRRNGNSQSVGDGLRGFPEFHGQENVNQIGALDGLIHRLDVATREHEAFFANQRLENGEGIMRGPDVIGMGFSVLELTAQNRDFMAFFPKFVREAIASRGRSIVQLIRAF